MKSFDVRTTPQFLVAGAYHLDNWLIYRTVKHWYCDHFPSDPLGDELNPETTFLQIIVAFTVKTGDMVYDCLGVHDSVLRSHVFSEIARITRTEPHEVYEAWQNCDCSFAYENNSLGQLEKPAQR